MNAADRITSFVLEKITSEPLPQQIEIYRAVAEVTADPKLAKELRIMADELRGILDRQMQLSFRASSRGNYGSR